MIVPPEPGCVPQPDIADWQRSMHEPRSVERLQAAYLVERSLRDRLMAAPCADRGRLYGVIYEELFRSLPDHPQLRRSPADKAQRITSQLAFLAPHLNPRTHYLEIGCGDASLTFAVAGKVAAAYGLDVTPELVATEAAPNNFRFVQTTGTDIALAEASVDLVYSNQLLEHLHPDDTVLQLREVHRVLRPGGCYLCRTPNRVTGPHDISCYFANTAQGLHLREYDAIALRRLFREAGFKTTRFFLVLRGHQIVLPYPLLALAERLMIAAPSRVRRRLAQNGLVRRIFGIDVVSIK